MSLTINATRLADITISGVGLRPLIGGYELQLFLNIKTHPIHQTRREAIIYGGHVSVQPMPGEKHRLGVATAEQIIRLRQYEHTHELTFMLCLPLQPQQISALEDLRNGGDLLFQLAPIGEGRELIENGFEGAISDGWTKAVSKSDWVKHLHGAGAMDILLIEVPMPACAGESSKTSDLLKRCQRHFVDGNYNECVALCRHVLDELGASTYGPNWVGAISKRMTENQKTMKKVEREQWIAFVVRHYMHQANHTEGDGGVAAYSRSDAKFALRLTAAVVANVFQE